MFFLSCCVGVGDVGGVLTLFYFFFLLVLELVEFIGLFFGFPFELSLLIFSQIRMTSLVDIATWLLSAG